MPGFLYIARNDQHREYVYKLGYTTVDPRHRAARLSNQLALSGDIGEFKVVHSVWVTATYDTEQALFDALADRRITLGREFFYGDELTLFRAMHAASQLCEGSTAALAEFLRDTPWKRSPRMHEPQQQAASVTDGPEDARGWAVAFQNPWHRPNTFRITVTTGSPRSFLNRLNSPQRNRTSQIGFFHMAICSPVRHPAEAVRFLSRALASHKIAGRNSFVRMPFEELGKAFDAMRLADATTGTSAASDGASAPARPTRGTASRSARKAKLIKPMAVDVPQTANLNMTTANCVHCEQLLLFADPPGTTGAAACPVCGGLFTCFVGRSAVTTGLYS